MSQIDRLLSEARRKAEESTQDESDFTEVRNKRKRFSKVPTATNNVRPMIVSIDPRPSQIQFAKAIRSKFPAVKIKQKRELRNNTDFFIQPEDLASRECLMLSLNLNQAFPNAKVNARNTLPKPKTKPSFVIVVNVHHSITEDEVKEELLNNNAINATEVSRITSRATGQPTKLICVITDSNNQVNAAQKHGVKIGCSYTGVKQAVNHHILCNVSNAKNLATQQGIALMQFDVFTARKIIVLKKALLPKKMPNAQTVAVLM